MRVIQLLLDHSCESVTEARAVCLQASGFEQLVKSLQNRFFKRAALIKQRLTRVKAKRPIELGLMKLNEQYDQLSADSDHFSALLKATQKGDAHHSWLASKVEACQRQRDELDEQAEYADRQRLAEEHRMNLIEGDLAFLEAIHHHPDWIEDRDQESVRGLLAIEGDQRQAETPPRPVLEAMLKRYSVMLQSPDREARTHFEHLITRLQQGIYAEAASPS